jgi:hypothetical protein
MRAIRFAAGVACAVCIFAIAASNRARADESFWHGVRSDIWNEGISQTQVSNWYSEHPPNGLADEVPHGTAIFAGGALRTNIVVKRDAEIGRIRFEPDAPLYTFRIARGRTLSITGRGLTNQSATIPKFTVLGDGSGRPGRMTLSGTARFVSASTAAAVEIKTSDGALLTLSDRSQGGNATVFNTARGQTVIKNRASAERMIITNSNRGAVLFQNLATGDQAHLINERRGQIDFTCARGPANDGVIPVGAIDNDGDVDLYDITLTVSQTFNQTANGSLNVDVYTPTRYGNIAVTGGASLDGDLDIVAHVGVEPGTYKIIHAKGGRTGKFARLTFNGRTDLRARLAYSRKEVALIVEEK